MYISDWNREENKYCDNFKNECGSIYNIIFDIDESRNAYILCRMSILDLLIMKAKIEQILLEDK
jgi:hypothetical protein